MEFIKAEQDQDKELIRTLARKSWENAYADLLSADQIEYMLGEMYSVEELRNHFQNVGYHYYLIKYSGDFAGFIGYENHYEPKTTKLHRIYLLPECKGKGMGKMSLEFLKEKTRLAGDERIILNVNKQNPAIKVYESQGFKVVDEGVFDIGNGYVMDDFIMEYRLEKEQL